MGDGQVAIWSNSQTILINPVTANIIYLGMGDKK